MAIQDRTLAAGTRLRAKYKGQVYTADVVQTEEGLRYRLADGRAFKSPSSAGAAVMGGTACNGWAFWRLDTGEGEATGTPRTRRTPAPAAPSNGSVRPAPKPSGTSKRGRKKVASAEAGEEDGVSEGIVCQACGRTFDTPAEATGHMTEAHPA